ncbi:MAG TPA: glycosyltransferase family 4 protein [bacterium]|nr:glycosyltransferase family 4 protein [bacterium]
MTNNSSGKLKILVLATMIYPDYFGGAAKVAFEQALQLQNLGHDVTIITLKKHHYFAKEEKIYGLRFLRYDNPVMRRMFGKSITAGHSLKKYLNSLKLKFDVVISHYPHDSRAFFRSQYKNVPLLYTFHAPSKKEMSIQKLNFEHRHWWGRFFHNAFVTWTHRCENYSLSHATSIAVMSHFMKTELITTHENIDKNKIHILSSGVDINAFQVATPEQRQALRQELGFNDEEMIFLTVRRLTERMGIENLISATGYLTKKYPNLRVKIIGDGLLRKTLQKQIKDNKLSDFVDLITELMDQKKLLKYYQAADCFVLPTKLLEGLGIATLEALATGLPVLGTPAGATPEILENINPAMIFRSTRPEHIAMGMQWFIEEGHKLSLPEQCRDYVVKNHNWKSIISNLEKVLYSIKK